LATNEEVLRSFLVALDWKNEAAHQKEFVGAIEGATLKANLLAQGIVEMAKSISSSVSGASEDFLKLGLLATQVNASVQTIVASRQAFKQIGADPQEAVSILQSVNNKMRSLNDGNLEAQKSSALVETKSPKN
jgi:hypothetical protein